jgi:hypothetical protein
MVAVQKCSLAFSLMVVTNEPLYAYEILDQDIVDQKHTVMWSSDYRQGLDWWLDLLTHDYT